METFKDVIFFNKIYCM